MPWRQNPLRLKAIPMPSAMRSGKRSSDCESNLAKPVWITTAHTIAWHLKEAELLVPAASTIWRILGQAGLVTPQPKKKPKAYIQRFQAQQPNETWQSDFTHWQLADGSDVEILNWLDDHSRFLLYCSAYRPVKGGDVVRSFQACINEYGTPASTLTDNGVVYTALCWRAKCF